MFSTYHKTWFNVVYKGLYRILREKVTGIWRFWVGKTALDKVANRFSRLVMLIVNPSLKPIASSNLIKPHPTLSNQTQLRVKKVLLRL
jgi:hypothetical protein